jgi:hypothetical protein
MVSFTTILQALRCTNVPIDQSTHIKPKAAASSGRLLCSQARNKEETRLPPNIIELLVASPYFQQYRKEPDEHLGTYNKP